MDRRLLAVLAAVLAASLVMVSAETDNSEATDTSGENLLLDYGNGTTEWLTFTTAGTAGDAIEEALGDSGISCSISSGTITVGGKTSTTVGSSTDSGGDFSTAGTTGNTETSSWHIYIWNSDNGSWEDGSADSSADGRILALGFYPDGTVPAVTPVYRSAWTMLCGDAENSLNQTVQSVYGTRDAEWSQYPDSSERAYGAYGGALYVQGHVITKAGSKATGSSDAELVCYSAADGTEEWSFSFTSNQMEIPAAVIVGDYVYVQTTTGYICKIPWAEGPGDNNENVTTFGGESWSSASNSIPNTTVSFGNDYLASYGQGCASLVCDSGALFAKAHNGMVYCFDLDLNLLWSYQTGGQGYYTAPTVVDGYVFAGMYDGCLYALNEADGTLIDEATVYQTSVVSGSSTVQRGCCNTVVPVESDDGLTLYLTYSDGLGMNSTAGGYAVYTFDGSTLTEVAVVDTYDISLNATASTLTRYVTDDASGAIIAANTGLYLIDSGGGYTLISDAVGGSNSSHTAPVLVNGERLYVYTYGSRTLFSMDTDGGNVESLTFDNNNYSMAHVCIADGYIVVGDDEGISVVTQSDLTAYIPPSSQDSGSEPWFILLMIILVIVAAVALLWAALRFGKGWKHPFADLRTHVMNYFFGENWSHNTKSKRKLRLIVLIGVLLTLAAMLLALCVGSPTTLSPGEALSALASSTSKGGRNLTYEEMLVYNSRLPRAVAAVAVGIGLSVAGAMYQAVIKNPLVEPYIMGVSSGAGTFALAVILTGFTFFGLFSADSIYLTAFSAIFGGLLAFAITMFLAEKTGGKSVNYVLAGIIVGLVFSAVQSLLMIDAGTKASSALSWLYGSFASVSWDEVWLILVPVIALSLVPLVWARELNLVLLGEDQARQMGLDARRFDRWMLIIASVMTAFCVAFCGIIGFVGLVIPHLSRMIVGGDHRMMLPVSIAFGGFLMVIADVLARTLLTGYELPVGAVTAVIGVPVFAYLLIKRGRGYDV